MGTERGAGTGLAGSAGHRVGGVKGQHISSIEAVAGRTRGRTCGRGQLGGRVGRRVSPRWDVDVVEVGGGRSA